MEETLSELKNMLQSLERQNENSNWQDEELTSLYDMTEYKITKMERDIKDGTC